MGRSGMPYIKCTTTKGGEPFAFLYLGALSYKMLWEQKGCLGPLGDPTWLNERKAKVKVSHREVSMPGEEGKSKLFLDVRLMELSDATA